MAMFNSYVSLPEGSYRNVKILFPFIHGSSMGHPWPFEDRLAPFEAKPRIASRESITQRNILQVRLCLWQLKHRIPQGLNI